MKRIVSILVALAAFGGLLNAQTANFGSENGYVYAHVNNSVFDNPDNKPYFGVRLGLDVTCPGDLKLGNVKTDLFNTGAGFHFGGVYNIPLYKNLYFEPGLLFYYNTMGSDLQSYDEDINISANLSARRFGFRIPFTFGYRFDFTGASVSVFTGPQLTVGLVGREKISAKYHGTKDSETVNLYSDDAAIGLNRVDLGWRFGVGLDFARNWTVELSGTVGMCNMLKDAQNASFRENMFNISLGYNFK